MITFNTKKVLTTFITVLSLMACSAAFSGVAVIVHPSNNNKLSAEQIAAIYLGKERAFPDGSEAVAIDQDESSSIRSSFVGNVLKKSNQQLKSYWAQLVFTGGGTPPKAVGSSTEVKKLVSNNPNIIGYIDASEVDSSVSVVGEF